MSAQWDYNLYAVKPEGTLRWKFAAGNPVFSSPAISADGTIYFWLQERRHLYAVNPDGTLKWKFTTGAILSIEIPRRRSAPCSMAPIYFDLR